MKPYMLGDWPDEWASRVSAADAAEFGPFVRAGWNDGTAGRPRNPPPGANADPVYVKLYNGSYDDAVGAKKQLVAATNVVPASQVTTIPHEQTLGSKLSAAAAKNPLVTLGVVFGAGFWLGRRRRKGT